MKILKYLFFLLLIVIIAGAIYVATQKGEYHIEETMIINAPLPVVYNEVNNLSNWGDWGPWRKEANDVIVDDITGDTRGEGAGFAWKSNELGDGSITTTRAIPFNAIDQVVEHHPTFADSESRMYWKFEEVEEGTKVTVGLEGNQTFREKLGFVFSNNSISQTMRPRLERSLDRLQNTVIQKMSVYSINVDGITTHGGGFYMYTSTSSKISQIPLRMKNMVTELRNYMETNNIPEVGEPFVLYNNWNDQNNSAIYSTGIFTPNMVITPQESDILNGMMPVQRVVKTTLKGEYSNLEEAWEAAYSYLEENNLQADEEKQPFEVYRTTEETTPNPANWVTEIYIPLLETPTQSPE
ncbi:AraC family transcriptional regulator [Antarcticibacterium flavum]|uniref:AraC family transcriptional regulator n=1 Tax=Antarcticibacterium flavum TaxID=2058175 RepID=A0A5B7X2E6_9FLAO|nr:MULTISPECIES: GyrI-like domain-containing protein [Antarcticibacterium]MCM4160740.1 AraC family transcriptional regulator [Antarcticibacterium sp. W02-3]QCY68783.1 AraC family transcriptional regulator [Antarcticibacterium flavum]